jgi:hypothetical protein
MSVFNSSGGSIGLHLYVVTFVGRQVDLSCLRVVVVVVDRRSKGSFWMCEALLSAVVWASALEEYRLRHR